MELRCKKWYYREIITANIFQFFNDFEYRDNFFSKSCFSFDLDYIVCSGGSIDQDDIKPHVDIMTAYYLHEQQTCRNADARCV